MKALNKSLQQILEDQISKWRALDTRPTQASRTALQVVTVSRQPGTGGSFIAAEFAKEIGLKLHHRDINQMIAERLEMERIEIDRLEEQRHSVLDSWIKAFTGSPQLWPEDYLEHLEKVIKKCGKVGGVIVGRGAHFVLDPYICMRVRIIGSFDSRVKRHQELLDLSETEACDRVVRREANRKAFIKKYYDRNIDDPMHYDLVLNMDYLNFNDAVQVLVQSWHILSHTRKVEGV